MPKFNTIQEAIAARIKEWEGKAGVAFSLSFYGNEMAGEIGEACNVIKKLEREQLGAPGSRDTVEHLAEELADGIICIRNIAERMGIDIDLAVEKKFNQTSAANGLTTFVELHLKTEDTF